MSWNPKTDLFTATTRGDGKRPQKVADAIRREISIMLVSRIKDPRLANLSIVKVEMTKDIKMARVYYSIFGDREEAKKAADGLAKAKGFIRSELARNLGLRYTPALEFIHDLSLVYQENMEKLLKEVAADDNAE